MKKNNSLKHTFVCVGFTRCGTTTLYEILKQHRRIKFPVVKEPYFYHIPSPPSEIWRKEKLYERGYEWFMKRYYPPALPKGMIVGEISPSIVVSTNARRLAKDYGSDTKIIFMLRNPVDRLYSHFKYGKQNVIKDGMKQSNAAAFHEMVKNNVPKNGNSKVKNGQYYTMISTGNYSRIIQEYMKCFPKENIKCILFEEFIKNQKQISREIYDFLGIPDDKTVQYNIRVNESTYDRGSLYALFIRMYYDYYLRLVIKYVPYMSESISRKLLGTPKLLQWIEKLDELVYKRNIDKTKMYAKDREILENYYSYDKQIVEKILDRNLSDLWF